MGRVLIELLALVAPLGGWRTYRPARLCTAAGTLPAVRRAHRAGTVGSFGEPVQARRRRGAGRGCRVRRLAGSRRLSAASGRRRRQPAVPVGGDASGERLRGAATRGRGGRRRPLAPGEGTSRPRIAEGGRSGGASLKPDLIAAAVGRALPGSGGAWRPARTTEPGQAAVRIPPARAPAPPIAGGRRHHLRGRPATGGSCGSAPREWAGRLRKGWVSCCLVSQRPGCGDDLGNSAGEKRGHEARDLRRIAVGGEAGRAGSTACTKAWPCEHTLTKSAGTTRPHEVTCCAGRARWSASASSSPPWRTALGS